MTVSVKKSWHHYMIFASALLGAASACSRWLWSDAGFNSGMKALGLHFFEGWLVFILLGMVAGLVMIKPIPSLALIRVIALSALSALALALEFLISKGVEHACNALWLSISGAALASFFSVWIWIRYAKNVHFNIQCDQ